MVERSCRGELTMAPFEGNRVEALFELMEKVAKILKEEEMLDAFFAEFKKRGIDVGMEAREEIIGDLISVMQDVSQKHRNYVLLQVTLRKAHEQNICTVCWRNDKNRRFK